MFYEDYKGICTLTSSASAKKVPGKPDFLVTDTYKYHILEAKGSSKEFRNDALTQGRIQVREIARINGNFPDLRLVSQSYFVSSALTVDIHDPEWDESEVFAQFSNEEFVNIFYKPLLNILATGGEIIEVEDKKYVSATYVFQNVGIGLDLEKFNKFSSKKIDVKNKNFKEFNCDNEYKIYSNGIVIFKDRK